MWTRKWLTFFSFIYLFLRGLHRTNATMDILPGPGTHAYINYNKDVVWKQKTFKVSQDWKINLRIIRPDQGSSRPRQTQTKREHQQHDAPPINKEPCSKRGTIHFSWTSVYIFSPPAVMIMKFAEFSMGFTYIDRLVSVFRKPLSSIIKKIINYFYFQQILWKDQNKHVSLFLHTSLTCLWLSVPNQLVTIDVIILQRQLTNILFL